MSEGHLRQMRLFAQNSSNILDEFSSQFEKGFLEILSHRHGTARVKANSVYQEYIANKHHVHMNATIWTTLTGFCIYLGKQGKAIVDETEKGWYIQYIDRNPKLLARQAQSELLKQSEVDYEARRKKVIEMQVKDSTILHDDLQEDDNSNNLFDREGVIGKIEVKLGGSNKKRPISSLFENNVEEEDELNDSSSNTNQKYGSVKLSHVTDLAKSGASLKAIQSRSWLFEGLHVKVVSKLAYNGNIYKQKGKIVKLNGPFDALVDIKGSKYSLKQEDLRTVIPAIGETVLLLKGIRKGSEGIVLQIHEDEYCCDVRVNDTITGIGTELKNIEYDDISKYSY